MPDVTPGQLDVLQHTIGADEYGRRQCDRNYYVAGEGHHSWGELLALVEAGLMTRRTGSELSGGDDVFHATREGMHHVARHSPAPPRLTAGQRRYQNFLDADGCMSFGEWLKAGGGRRA